MKEGKTKREAQNMKANEGSKTFCCHKTALKKKIEKFSYD